MKFEEGIWAEHEQTNEQKIYVSVLEESINEYVEKGRLPEMVALSILQKIESYPKHFDSEKDARHQAHFFFETRIMPIIYQFDDLLRGEADIATQQGNLILKKELLESRYKDLHTEGIKQLQELIDSLETDREELLERKRDIEQEVIN